MKRKGMIILITLIFILTSCTKSNSIENLPSENTQKQEYKKRALKNISLNFTPIAKEALTEEKPNLDWIKAKSISIVELLGQKEAYIHLYLQQGTNTDEGIVHAFIEHQNKFYAVGNEVSNYGIQDVEIKLVDRNFDDKQDIEIIGGMGATSIEMKIISYDEVSKEWVRLLTMGSPTVADLENDGREELIASSAGSLPGYVEIYKWNGNQFEKADVGEQTGNIYANIQKKNGDWIIETGREGKPYYYRYFEGKLIEQEYKK